MSKICPERRSLKPKKWATHLSVGITLLYSFAFSQKSSATLVIALRHKDEACLASDGLLSNQHQATSGHHLKCFQASDTSCVAISGFGGAEVTIETNLHPTSVNVQFPQQLEQIASEESVKHLPFLQSVTNILNRFTSVYGSFMSWEPIANSHRYTNCTKFGDTDVYFFGFDAKSGAFCQLTARYSPDASNTFKLDTTEIATNCITFLGESGFLSTLMAGADPKINLLRTKKLTAALSTSLTGDETINAKIIRDGILQLFALHKKYTKKYNYDDGLIGPPYVVYRITTTNVNRIYFGNGANPSDTDVVAIFICTVVFTLIVAVLGFALRT